MRRLYSVLFLMFTGMMLNAQPMTGKAVLTVVNEQKQPVESATVELLNAKDSSLVKTALTDKAGTAEFEVKAKGSYLARISSVGLKTQLTDAVSVTDEGQQVTIPTVVMATKPENQLQTITVSAKKPFIQKLSDRIVVNVENSAVNAGSTALDVLERSPGVTVDQNDAIALRGRQGVIIMIDGKPTPMNGADLANYLRGLPVNAIERIDIITNPSAKYDAAGNSGIIDIRLKKDQKLGTNGTLTAGYSQGILPKTNAGTTFNYRNKTVNVFGNYSYSYREFMNRLVLNRNFFDNGVFMGSDDKDNNGKMGFGNHAARVGADFFPSDKSIFGFVVSSNFTDIDRRSVNGTTVNNSNYVPYYKFNTIATNDDYNNNMVANINYKYKFNKQGKEVSIDADYGRYKSGSLTRTSSSFFNLDGSKRKDDDILDGDQVGKLTLKTAKVDYVNPVKQGSKFEAGFKTSYVASDNDAKFFNVLGADREVDMTKTNQFLYEEYNNAGYVNYNKEIGKWNMQLGLRGEQTTVKTRQVKGNMENNNDYFMLFPSAFVNYNLKENNTIGASVSRRIDRPGYAQLNPFLFQIDATVYATGNPQLKPQTTWSYEMSYTLKNLNFTLGYSKTKDVQNIAISRILDVIPTFEIKQGQDSNITVQIPINLSTSEYYGLNTTLPVKITSWWNTLNSVNIFYNHFNANIGGARLNDGAPAMNLRVNNTFTFKKGWQAELNYNLNTGGQYGYMVSEPQWGVAVGAQKSVMKNKGSIKLNMTDIFWTNLPKATITYPGSYIENWHATRDTRVANLSFTYRFGNSKVQAARKRTTASEEERQRAGN